MKLNKIDKITGIKPDFVIFDEFICNKEVVLMNKEAKLKEKIKDLERQIKIKDAWCGQIWTIGFDYDGYNDVKNLKDIIDELVDYSQKAIACDDTTVVYTSVDGYGNTAKANILFEELGDGNESK